MKPLYTAKVHVEGGREGKARSMDGLLDVKMAMPKSLGGSEQGTNPEQLFAAGFAACFQGAMGVVAKQMKVSVSDNTIDSEVSIYQNPSGAGFYLGVAMKVTIPSMPQAAAEKLVAEAHKVCPYSNATRGNIEVGFTVTGKG